MLFSKAVLILCYHYTFNIVNRDRKFPSAFYIWSQYRICLNLNSQNREMGGESIGASTPPHWGTPDPLRWHWAPSMFVSREDRLALLKQLLALQPCTDICPDSPFSAWLVYISVFPFCGAGSSFQKLCSNTWTKPYNSDSRERI